MKPQSHLTWTYEQNTPTSTLNTEHPLRQLDLPLLRNTRAAPVPNWIQDIHSSFTVASANERIGSLHGNNCSEEQRAHCLECEVVDFCRHCQTRSVSTANPEEEARLTECLEDFVAHVPGHSEVNQNSDLMNSRRVLLEPSIGFVLNLRGKLHILEDAPDMIGCRSDWQQFCFIRM